MKTILYATDNSKKSSLTLRYAYRLSAATNARLHVLNVYDLPPISLATMRSPKFLNEHFEEEHKEMLTQYCDTHLKHELNRKPVRIEVCRNSSVTDGIVKTINRLHPDLVIVGMKDSDSLRGTFTGNIANRLLDTIDIPMLIVPNTSYFHGFSTLLYATDFEESDIQALQNVVDIASPFGALVKVVHIPRKHESDTPWRMAWFKNAVQQRISYPEMVFSIIPATDIESGLSSCLQNERADVLIMLEREHTGLYNRLFHKDLVRIMESEISVPLLVFNQKKIQLKTTEQTDFSFEPVLN